MTPVRVARRDLPGPRVWILGARIHHGLIGAALALSRRPRLVLIGALLMLHDVSDFPWPLIERLPIS